MAKLNFPIIGTKIKGLNKSFDTTNPVARTEYFQAKVGQELKAISKFLDNNSFIAYFIGKKNSGKGTYSKLFAEAVGGDKIVHLSVGDLVREVHSSWDEFVNNEKYQRLKSYYRGYISFDEAVDRFLSRSASKLLPTEFILALLRMKFEELAGKSVFLDGFPREENQISYSLLFKDLVGRSNNKDMFILIDIPDAVIDERIKYRVICPVCNTPRNPKLLITSRVGFDKNTREFFLMCDNPGCNDARMVRKEGDDLGIKPIRERLNQEQEILEKTYELYGVPKLLLRNSVPVEVSGRYFDDYEITPAFSFELDAKTQQPIVKESPWIIQDNQEVNSYSLMPSPVVVSLIKQMAKVLQEE